MKKIIIIILYIIIAPVLGGFTLSTQTTNTNNQNALEILNPRPCIDGMNVVNISNEERWQ